MTNAHNTTSFARTTTFASWIQKRPVCDASGQRVGFLKDFLVTPESDSIKISSLVIQGPRRRYTIPGDALASVGETLKLRCSVADYPQSPEPDEAVHLVRDVLDAQVIDTKGAKVIRVNDIQLDWVGEHLVVSGVDIGPWGIARRLGVAPALAWVVQLLHLRLGEGLVPWSKVLPIDKGFHLLRLKVPTTEISRLHPADLAQIVADLDREEQQRILADLPVDHVADVMESSASDLQVALLREMEPERAADILEAMEPDEAADLLDDLPDAAAEDLMELMEPKRAEDVRQLLTFEDDTAGAMMTTRLIQLPSTFTAGEALDWFRVNRPEVEIAMYLYLTDQDGLSGVVSLRKLLLAEPQTRLDELSPKQIVSVLGDDLPRDVISKIKRYRLGALPVVDETNRLIGVISVLDVLEAVLEPRER